MTDKKIDLNSHSILISVKKVILGKSDKAEIVVNSQSKRSQIIYLHQEVPLNQSRLRF
jgi:hypothetical protein